MERKINNLIRHPQEKCTICSADRPSYNDFLCDSCEDKQILDDARKSAESRTFDTGSKRDTNDHKPRIADLKPYTRKKFGYHMLKGSKRYGLGNFELGQPNESSWESIDRHMVDYQLGDRSEDHLMAILFGIQLIALNEQKEGIEPDHYYKKYLAEQEVKDDEGLKDVFESIYNKMKL